jgi:hypothetical protein
MLPSGPPLKKPIADSWSEAVDLGIDAFRAEQCPVCRVGCTYRTSDLVCYWCQMERIFRARITTANPHLRKRHADRPDAAD